MQHRIIWSRKSNVQQYCISNYGKKVKQKIHINLRQTKPRPYDILNSPGATSRSVSRADLTVDTLLVPQIELVRRNLLVMTFLRLKRSFGPTSGERRPFPLQNSIDDLQRWRGGL